jgi:phage terminase, large subunit, PBSX family|nr:MAG TPA: large terminase [Caudoviricetes sp.]
MVRETRKKKTIDFIFGEKHKEYIRQAKNNTYNIAEGAIRAGKTVDNIFAFAHELKSTQDRIHIATGSTVANAKLNIGDANGYGLEYIFRGQCRWGKHKGNEALIIKGEETHYKTRIVIFSGAAKADSYKSIRGNSYGMWIATEINLHHKDSIKECFNRTAAAKNRKFFWDLNPSNPKHFIYLDHIEKYRKLDKEVGGVNYEHFTIRDNATLDDQRIKEIELQYDPESVWYKRDILGLRIVAEGLIYKQFADDPKKYITDKRPAGLELIQIGVDFGGNNSKHAMVASAITKDNAVVVLKSSIYEPNKPTDLNNQLIDFIREVQSRYGTVSVIYADSAEQVLIKGMQKALLDNDITIKIKNSIKNKINDRIRLVNSLIATNRFLYTRDCNTLVDALSLAVYEDDKQEDTRLDDGTSDIDTLDAFEYSIENHLNRLMKL